MILCMEPGRTVACYGLFVAICSGMGIVGTIIIARELGGRPGARKLE